VLPPLRRERYSVLTVRRLFGTLPLAALVAVLAHVVTFGTAHAPGGAFASALLAALALALGLPLVATFLGLDCAARTDASSWIRNACTAAGNGIAAVLVFGAIEFAEGHTALPLAALLAVLPLAALTLAGLRLTRRIAGRAGLRARAWARVRVRRDAILFVRRVRAASLAALRTGRLAGAERAPPVLA